MLIQPGESAITPASMPTQGLPVCAFTLLEIYSLTDSLLENSTLTTGTPLEIKFDRNSGRCDSLNDYPTGNYSLWLHNNPVRNMGFVNSDYKVKIQDGISSDATSVIFTLPDDLPEVADDTVWYLRLDTYLPTAPQVRPLLCNTRVDVDCFDSDAFTF